MLWSEFKDAVDDHLRKEGVVDIPINYMDFGFLRGDKEVQIVVEDEYLIVVN